ncbi:hypothetical protein F3J19_26060 [Burkholderia sp. Ax-1724]|nr:hypothetical protein [Burkholderia sp. Ax-1724]
MPQPCLRWPFRIGWRLRFEAAAEFGGRRRHAGNRCDRSGCRRTPRRHSACKGYRLVVIRDGVEDEEDWRFFDPASDAKHLVIEDGKVDPWSLS